MSEAIETPMPETVQNHWWWRPGHADGRHFWACHLILDDQPELRQLAADYQQALTGLAGIDPIPARWLHLTMQGIAFTGEITTDEVGHLDHALAAALAEVEPLTVEFRALTVQREAVSRPTPPHSPRCAVRRMTPCCRCSAPSGSPRPRPTWRSGCLTSASATSPTTATRRPSPPR